MGAGVSALTKDHPGCSGRLRRVPRPTRCASRCSMPCSMGRQRLSASTWRPLALWEYCEDSARYIFGDATGDPIADQVDAAVRNNPEGITQNALMNLFGRNVPAAKLHGALETLLRLQRIASEQVVTGGRPCTVWKATS